LGWLFDGLPIEASPRACFAARAASTFQPPKKGANSNATLMVANPNAMRNNSARGRKLLEAAAMLLLVAAAGSGSAAAAAAGGANTEDTPEDTPKAITRATDIRAVGNARANVVAVYTSPKSLWFQCESAMAPAPVARKASPRKRSST